MQKNKTVVIGAVILLVLVGIVVYFLLSRDSNVEPVVIDDSEFTSVSGDENNSIIVNDQIPGNVVFFQNLTLEEDGFVVVRAEENGAAGEVIGSLFVEAGSDITGSVELSEPTVEGGVYYVDLYTDTDGNGVFDENVDMRVVTTSGNPIRVQIETTEDLPEIKG